MTNAVQTASRKRNPIRYRRRRKRPTLQFSPYAWAKLLFLRDLGTTEVGGFGIGAADDLLLVEDVRLVGQRTTSVTVEFDDEAVADFFDEQVDAGLAPEHFFRIWLHTHPGDSAEPSTTDEETFQRVFGRCDWAVMGILAVGGQTYARLRFNAGPGGQMKIPVRIVYARPFAGSDHEGWQDEYERCVRPQDVWQGPQALDEQVFGWPELDPTDVREFLHYGSIDALEVLQLG